MSIAQAILNLIGEADAAEVIIRSKIGSPQAVPADPDAISGATAQQIKAGLEVVVANLKLDAGA